MPAPPLRLGLRRALLAALSLALGAAGPFGPPAARADEPPPFSEADYDRRARRVVPRDAFPVLFDPPLADAADARRGLRDDDPVIGVVVNGESRAYPVPVMGVHELVNDTCGGVPVAVSW